MNLRKGLAINVFLVILTVGTALRADWHSAEERKPSASQPGGGRVEKMAQNLGLTKDQQDKLQSLYQSRDKQLQSLYAEFRSKRLALQDDTDGKVQALLTAEQREKLKKMQEKKLVERTKSLGARSGKKP